MIFRDREHAAELLLACLESSRFKDLVVLAVPRGAVPMGKRIADRLAADFDVVLVHKIGAPDQEEFAVGSASEDGTVYRSEGSNLLGLSDEQLHQLAQPVIQMLQARRAQITPLHPPLPLRGRDVLLVDDGIATGSTLVAATLAVRAQGARRITIAVPVAAYAAVSRLEPLVDHLCILQQPSDFRSVGQWYEHFPQVEDAEVLEALRVARRRSA